MLRKVLAGGGSRISRLHDELGNLVSASRLIRNGPRAVGTGIARRLFGYRPVRPWMSYDVQTTLEKHLTPTSRVLEFGSGMSTVWYGEHAREVISIEDYAPWYDKVGKLFEARKVSNVRYRFAADPGEYATVPPDERGEGFDLIIIDGSARDRCAHEAVGLLRPNGLIYLDNSDKSYDPRTGDVPAARDFLIDHARDHGWAVEFFTDFAPTQLFVEQGLLVRRPA